jgi:hypothetical protein
LICHAYGLFGHVYLFLRSASMMIYGSNVSCMHNIFCHILIMDYAAHIVSGRSSNAVHAPQAPPNTLSNIRISVMFSILSKHLAVATLVQQRILWQGTGSKYFGLLRQAAHLESKHGTTPTRSSISCAATRTTAISRVPRRKVDA